MSHDRRPRSILSKLLFEYSTAWVRSFFGDKDKAALEFRELAVKCRAAGVPMLSRPCLERAIQLAPQEISYRIDLGWLYYEQVELNQARTQFEEALKIDFGNESALIGKAITLHQLGQLEDAIYYYLAYLSRRPKDVDTLVNLGILFQSLGRYNEALDVLGKAAAVDDRNPLVHEYFGQALYGLGRFDEAVMAFKKAIDLDPRSSSVHNGLGLTYELVGDDDKAEACYREAIRRDSLGDQGEPRLNLARLLDWRDGDANEAADLAKKAVELFRLQGKNDFLAQTLWELGWIHYRLGRWDESIQASSEALKLNPSSNPVRFNLALAMLRSGKATEAQAEYQRALDQVKDVSELRRHGIRDLEQALHVDPNVNGAKEIMVLLRKKEKELSARIESTTRVRRPSATEERP